MLVEGDAVEPQLVHQRPSFQVLAVVAHRRFGLEVTLGQWVRELVSLHRVMELYGIAHMVEDENLHYFLQPPRSLPVEVLGR